MFNTSSSVNLTKSSSFLANLLDSSFDIYYSPYSLNIIFRDHVYVVDSTTKLKTIYDLYLENGGIIPNPHQEEIDILESFYTVVIDRLGYLAKEMSSNYIYLSIFAIFVFIFVIELIRRRCI